MVIDVKQIRRLLDEHFAKNGRWTINKQGLVSGTGDIRLYASNLTQLPVNFDRVEGYFECRRTNLTTLEGSPSYVGGYFYCAHNKLRNLKGAPTHVGADFDCSENLLRSDLMGAPDHVGGNFNFRYNRLRSLEGLPATVGGDIFFNYSKTLPLLRLLSYPEITAYNMPPEVANIMNKYGDLGKKGALACAVELTKAGFKDNAKW